MIWVALVVSQLILVVICRGFLGMTFWPTQAVLTVGVIAFVICAALISK